MRRDEIYENLAFDETFSVQDWNALIEKELGKYFLSKDIFESNKGVLRTEIINYIKVHSDQKYLALLNWTFSSFNECIGADENYVLKELADSFHDLSDSDSRWFTNVLTQPDITLLSERDKIDYHLKLIGDILEGCFLPRLKFLTALLHFKLHKKKETFSSIDFGILIRDFPEKMAADLLLKDPIFSIPTNQWRNIVAHKSYDINKTAVEVWWDKGKIKRAFISYEDIYHTFGWVQSMYRALRLGEVLFTLNYIPQIVSLLGGVRKIKLRFEATLLHLIHNIQIVGFRFVSTKELDGAFIINLIATSNSDLRSSLIHASQFLSQLSLAIYDDEHVKDKFQLTTVNLVSEQGVILATTSVKIEMALKHAESKLDLKEYLQYVTFDFLDDI